MSYGFAIKNSVFRICFKPGRFSSARLKTDSDLKNRFTTENSVFRKTAFQAPGLKQTAI